MNSPQEAATLLGVATAPAFGKVVYLRGFTKPGVYGDYSQSGVTGYGMFPLDRLRFGDIDRHSDIAEITILIPRLADSYWQYRGDHAACAAIMAYNVPNSSVDEGKHELRSSRGPGLYQIGSGSRHPSGHIYRGNGKAPIVLNAAETARWAEFFGTKSRVRTCANLSI